MKIIALILSFILIDFTMALDCRNTPINKCLDHCDCFECIIKRDNDTLIKCYPQGADIYDHCDLHDEVIKPNEKTCMEKPFPVALMIGIIVLSSVILMLCVLLFMEKIVCDCRRIVEVSP